MNAEPPSRMTIASVAQPATVCDEKATLADAEAIKSLSQGKPVAVRLPEGWRLLTPAAAAGYALTRRVIDLSLITPPLLPEETSLAEAVARIHQAGTSYGLVMSGEELRGIVCLCDLTEAIAERLREGEEAGRMLSKLLFSTRAWAWRAPLPPPGERCGERLRSPCGLEIYGPIQEITGFTAEDFRRNSDLWFSRIHPEDRLKTLEATRQLARTGLATTLEYRFQTAEGRWIYQRDEIIPQKEEQGRIVEFCGVSCDVTEQWAARRTDRLLARLHRLAALRRPGEDITPKLLEQIAEELPIDVVRLWGFHPTEGATLRLIWAREPLREKAAELEREAGLFLEKLHGNGHKESPEEAARRLCPAIAAAWDAKSLVFVRDRDAPPLEGFLPCGEACGAQRAGFRLLFSDFIGEVEGTVWIAEILSAAERPPLEKPTLDLARRLAPTMRHLGRIHLTEEALQGAKRRLEQRNCQLELLYRLAQKLSRSLTYEELFWTVMEDLHQVMRCECGALALLKPGGKSRVLLHSSRPLSSEAERSLLEKMAAGAGAAGLALTLPSLKTARRRVADPEGPPITRIGSFFQAPLIAAEEERDPIGLFLVGAEEEGAFSEGDVKTLATITRSAGLTVERIQALVASEKRRLLHILESAPEGMALFDQKGRLLFSNSMGKELLEILNGGPLPQNRLERLGPIPAAKIFDPALEGRQRECVLKKERDWTFEYSVIGIEIEPGERGWLLVVRDVTEQRESERRNEQQARLAALGQLAAGIAHDFNNLLTPIIGYADLLDQEEKPSPQVAESLQVIRAQATRAAELVAQILDFGRKRIDEKSRVDIGLFLREGVKMLERTFPESIRVSIQADSGPHLAEVNPGAVQQILTNLALNARNAMPQGGEFRVVVEPIQVGPDETPPMRGLAPGRWVRLRFADTGCGIPPEHLGRIFEPFFTTRVHEGGSGLGLAQVYGIVQQHGGIIDVRSEVGKGTEFIIYLPAVEQKEEKSRLGKALEPPAAAPPQKAAERGVVLLAEDAAPVRIIVSKLLEKHGCRVLHAADGAEALRLWDETEGKIDLLITDWVMPRMGGRELIQAIRKRRPDLKVVVLSGYPLGEEQTNKQLRVDMWLKKPVGGAQLAEVLQKLLVDKSDRSQGA